MLAVRSQLIAVTLGSYKTDFFEPSFPIFRRQQFLEDGPLLKDLACLGCIESWTMRSKLA